MILGLGLHVDNVAQSLMNAAIVIANETGHAVHTADTLFFANGAEKMSTH